MVLGACSCRGWRDAPGLPNMVPNPLPPGAAGRVAVGPDTEERLSAATGTCFFPETAEGVEVNGLLAGSLFWLVRPADCSAAVEPFGLLLSTSTIAAHLPTSSRATLRTA